MPESPPQLPPSKASPPLKRARLQQSPVALPKQATNHIPVKVNSHVKVQSLTIVNSCVPFRFQVLNMTFRKCLQLTTFIIRMLIHRQATINVNRMSCRILRCQLIRLINRSRRHLRIRCRATWITTCRRNLHYPNQRDIRQTWDISLIPAAATILLQTTFLKRIVSKINIISLIINKTQISLDGCFLTIAVLTKVVNIEDLNQQKCFVTWLKNLNRTLSKINCNIVSFVKVNNDAHILIKFNERVWFWLCGLFQDYVLQALEGGANWPIPLQHITLKSSCFENNLVVLFERF